MLIDIKNDLFFISSRLKEIDPKYEIKFNTRTKKFEVHHAGQIGGSYCLTLPYNALDARAVEYVLKTRIENRKAIIEEIDKINEKIEKEKKEKVIEKVLEEFNKKVVN